MYIIYVIKNRVELIISDVLKIINKKKIIYKNGYKVSFKSKDVICFKENQSINYIDLIITNQFIKKIIRANFESFVNSFLYEQIKNKIFIVEKENFIVNLVNIYFIDINLILCIITNELLILTIRYKVIYFIFFIIVRLLMNVIYFHFIIWIIYQIPKRNGKENKGNNDDNKKEDDKNKKNKYENQKSNEDDNEDYELEEQKENEDEKENSLEQQKEKEDVNNEEEKNISNIKQKYEEINTDIIPNEQEENNNNNNKENKEKILVSKENNAKVGIDSNKNTANKTNIKANIKVQGIKMKNTNINELDKFKLRKEDGSDEELSNPYFKMMHLNMVNFLGMKPRSIISRKSKFTIINENNESKLFIQGNGHKFKKVPIVKTSDKVILPNF